MCLSSIVVVSLDDRFDDIAQYNSNFLLFQDIPNSGTGYAQCFWNTSDGFPADIQGYLMIKQ